MKSKTAKANVIPVRQTTQYSCMASSLTMCLRALGKTCSEKEVAEVMGVKPMRGATWEDAIAAAQHYGCRATLVCPSTINQLREWTSFGDPVMIAWNPEGRDWSHASVVFDVLDNDTVIIADPNIPDPNETTRVVPKAEFYSKWSEKWPRYIVRRPAMRISLEISEEGRPMMASIKRADQADRFRALNILRQRTYPDNILNLLVKHLTEAVLKRVADKFNWQVNPRKNETYLDAIKNLAHPNVLIDEIIREASDMEASKALNAISTEFGINFPEFTHWRNDMENPKLSNDEFKRLLEARFPEGEDMTVDEVAEVVGPEFKEQHDKNKDKFKKEKKSFLLTTREFETALSEMPKSATPVPMRTRMEPVTTQVKKATLDTRTIAKNFPELNWNQAEAIYNKIASTNNGTSVGVTLSNFNEVSNGLGISTVKNASHEVAALYVEKGDPNSTTLLYDTKERSFYVASYNSWRKKFEQLDGGKISPQKW